MDLPIKGGRVWSTTSELEQRWSDAYPAVDVRGELAKMRLWLEANPTRRKTERGMPRFVVNWLSRAEQRRRETRDWRPKLTGPSPEILEQAMARARAQHGG